MYLLRTVGTRPAVEFRFFTRNQPSHGNPVGTQSHSEMRDQHAESDMAHAIKEPLFAAAEIPLVCSQLHA